MADKNVAVELSHLMSDASMDEIQQANVRMKTIKLESYQWICLCIQEKNEDSSDEDDVTKHHQLDADDIPFDFSLVSHSL